MNSINNVLDSMKRKLSVIPGVLTCKVGLEANISPKDYPIIRIKVAGFMKSDKVGSTRIADLWIYFGLPLVEGSISLETIIERLMILEEAVIDATRIGEDYRSTYIRTIISDPTEISHYQLAVVVLQVEFST